MTKNEIALTDPGDKISKLVAMLISLVPGEVVAAAAALHRLLKRSGKDWNDVAHAIEATGSPPLAPDAKRSWRTAVRECLAYPRWLTVRDREFLYTMLDTVEPFEKQLKWIFGLQRRVRA